MPDSLPGMEWAKSISRLRLLSKHFTLFPFTKALFEWEWLAAVVNLLAKSQPVRTPTLSASDPSLYSCN